ncbi:hypothetical protein [Pseudomonas entomophila]|uniref:hypothetical protein n=1 Tax=Pseudomonas entomophila TaxID=312306 RepID=UPI001F01CB7A|nr:hypothetical protein [Pseudomonas entomophila]MCG8291291.1 hypothetical protein [Pseudomonas entomophila]
MRTLHPLVIGQLFIVTSGSALAYESDVHYGLTYWLASKAGYSAVQSNAIAQGNELTDTGVLDAKHAIIWELCIMRNHDASLKTRQLHFRAKRAPPAQPEDRPLSNVDNPFAQTQSRSVIKEDKPEPVAHLQKFGQALHGWQDSYSHEGVSNRVKYFCPSKWIWSHPVAQGSVFSHKADQTHWEAETCRKAAKTTYELLLSYRAHMQLSRPAEDWQALEKATLSFCEAPTKSDKADWFKAEGVPQPEAIARNLSLENGKRNFYWAPRMDLVSALPEVKTPQPTILEYEKQVPGWYPDQENESDLKNEKALKELLSHPRADAPESVQTLARAFLREWITSDPEKLRFELARFFGNRPLDDGDARLSTLLRLRLKDQGKPDAAKVIPKYGTPEYDGYIVAKGEEWPTYFVPVRGRGTEALVGLTETGTVVMIAILRNAPDEVLLVRADKDFQIERVDSLIFH